ncbi:hypothetical protein [Ketobacter sp.]|uniref:hypothetical protein n=1 Tax=Ketobacter sp. TaxID=2083498 RepID=UPI000F2D3603|nr:hypothetical protein [Ketobacter sp.]RLT95992.1 MAG: hypothetical protein D9N14_13945 [Ketobacter sp.]
MNTLKAWIGGSLLACAAVTSMNASAGIYDYEGTYQMDCNNATRTIGVAFAYGEIAPTQGAVLLNDADSHGHEFTVEFDTCDDFTFDDIDAAKVQELYAKARAKCIETDMPIGGIVKEAVCSIAAGEVRNSLEDSVFPDPQTYIGNYVTNAINLDVSCALVFFSWCLQYGTDTTYSFDSGNSLYYHAYINNAGKWMENFALNNVLQQPSLPCVSLQQAVLNGDAAAAGTVVTSTNLLDGHTCLIPNPFDPSEMITMVLGMNVGIRQSGAE